MTATENRHATLWPWIAAIWCAGALFEAGQAVLIMRFAEYRRDAWLPLFAIELVTWLPWVLATPLIVSLARRYRIIRGTTVRSVAVHLASCATISAVAESWSAVLHAQFNTWAHLRPDTFADAWGSTLLYHGMTYVTAYALIVTITHLADSRDDAARQMTETARVNEELANAKLAALRRQMEPHFMYNTLNSLAALVRDHRNDAAVNMIVGLSEFLRRSSEDSHRSQVTLAEEVEYLQRYVDIQKVRFGERLRVSIDIPADLMNTQVPNLLLQPLVENAIKHGVSTRVAGGTVRVAGARQNGKLHLSVYNDGPGFTEGWQTGAGVGLANLRTRLEILHGDASDIAMSRTGTDGVEVVVTLPLEDA